MEVSKKNSKIQTLSKTMELQEMKEEEKKEEDTPEQYHHERTNSWKTVGFFFTQVQNSHFNNKQC